MESPAVASHLKAPASPFEAALRVTGKRRGGFKPPFLVFSLVALAAFDAQLHERFLERGLHRGHFLSPRSPFIAACARATAASAALSSIAVDSSAMSVRMEIASPVISAKPSPTGERRFPSALVNAQFARLQSSQHRDVLWVNTQFPVAPGQNNHLHILGIGLGFRSDDFEMKGAHFSLQELQKLQG